MSNLTPIEDLTPDVVQEWKLEEFNAYLNRQPPKQWLMDHPLANNVKYLPIDKVEYLLRKIFRHFKIEILRESTMFNSVYCTVRVHYFHPIKQEWSFHDGLGAWDVQTKAGASVADLGQINHMAVAKALPAAESAAIKDACDKFGDLFGANINRKGTLQFEPSEKLKDKIGERIQLLVEQAETIEDIERLINSNNIPDEYMELVENKMEQLREN